MLRVKTALRFCLLLSLGACLYWVFILHEQLEHCYALARSDATARLLDLADLVESEYSQTQRIPESEEELWEFAARSSRLKLVLPYLCRGPEGPFQYEKIGTNQFKISFRMARLKESIAVVSDGTHSKVERYRVEK
jgi:hypothetical protein